MNCVMCDKELNYSWNIDYENKKYHRQCFDKLKIKCPHYKKYVPNFVENDIEVFNFNDQKDLLDKIGNKKDCHFVKNGASLMTMKDDKSWWFVLGFVVNFELDLPEFKCE